MQQLFVDLQLGQRRCVQMMAATAAQRGRVRVLQARLQPLCGAWAQFGQAPGIEPGGEFRSVCSHSRVYLSAASRARFSASALRMDSARSSAALDAATTRARSLELTISKRSCAC